MKLYLVQHAKAASKEADPQRGLTEEGRRDTAKVAAFLKPLDLSVGYLWHSGKKRAEQTAQILREVLKAQVVETREGLAPNDEVADLMNELAPADTDIMVVGHLPFLSKLASLLLTRSESPTAVAFKNAGVVSLERTEHGRWHVHWVVTPELLV